MSCFYRFAQLFSYFYFKIFHRFEVKGMNNVPLAESFILASNHLSFIDPPALGCKLPRNLHYFARDSLFRGPLGFLIRRLNSIPVNRDRLDLKTYRMVLSVLNDGNPLLVFPEGTRSRDGRLSTPQKGIGFLVAKSGVSVLPARIEGSFEILGPGRRFPYLGKKLKVTYGRLLSSEEMKLLEEAENPHQKIAERIMSAIREIE